MVKRNRGWGASWWLGGSLIARVRHDEKTSNFGALSECLGGAYHTITFYMEHETHPN